MRGLPSPRSSVVRVGSGGGGTRIWQASPTQTMPVEGSGGVAPPMLTAGGGRLLNADPGGVTGGAAALVRRPGG